MYDFVQKEYARQKSYLENSSNLANVLAYVTSESCWNNGN